MCSSDLPFLFFYAVFAYVLVEIVCRLGSSFGELGDLIGYFVVLRPSARTICHLLRLLLVIDVVLPVGVNIQHFG